MRFFLFAVYLVFPKKPVFKEIIEVQQRLWSDVIEVDDISLLNAAVQSSLNRALGSLITPERTAVILSHSLTKI